MCEGSSMHCRVGALKKAVQKKGSSCRLRVSSSDGQDRARGQGISLNRDL